MTETPVEPCLPEDIGEADVEDPPEDVEATAPIEQVGDPDGEDPAPQA